MSTKIEVCFITSDINDNSGSYRLWVKDLAEYFNELGITAYINKLTDNIKSNVVIILGKSDVGKCEDYKRNYPNNLINFIEKKVGIFQNFDKI